MTVPLVETEPSLETTMVYVRPVWPCANIPLWVFATTRSAACTMVVGSVAVLFAVLLSLPPETVAVLITVDGASLSTETVTVMLS